MRFFALNVRGVSRNGRNYLKVKTDDSSRWSFSKQTIAKNEDLLLWFQRIIENDFLPSVKPWFPLISSGSSAFDFAVVYTRDLRTACSANRSLRVAVLRFLVRTAPHHPVLVPTGSGAWIPGLHSKVSTHFLYFGKNTFSSLNSNFFIFKLTIAKWYNLYQTPIML